MTDMTYLPPTSELRKWANHPSASGTVPVAPVTLMAIAAELDKLRGVDMWTRLQNDASEGADLSPGDPVAAWAVNEIRGLRQIISTALAAAKLLGIEQTGPNLAIIELGQQRNDLHKALQDMMAEVEVTIQMGVVPGTWRNERHPDQAIVNARNALQKIFDLYKGDPP